MEGTKHPIASTEGLLMEVIVFIKGGPGFRVCSSQSATVPQSGAHFIPTFIWPGGRNAKPEPRIVTVGR
jgi:hypothetical protein